MNKLVILFILVSGLLSKTGKAQQIPANDTIVQLYGV